MLYFFFCAFFHGHLCKLISKRVSVFQYILDGGMGVIRKLSDLTLQGTFGW